MTNSEKLTISDERDALIGELERRFSQTGKLSNQFSWQYFFKKYSWLIVIGGAKLLKRAIDIFVSGSMLVALAPLFAVIALAIKMTDGGGILFWQSRVGVWGKEFPFPKFRSMVADAEKIKDKLLAQNQHAEAGGVTFKMKNDPRITWIGRIIRKFSLDELPQLWCVLKGDMSLVGPRPPVPREVSLYTLNDRRRLNITPGLTCIWQVSGRSEIPFPEQVKLDVQYIDSQSVWFDILLLLKTVPAVLFGKGAY